MRAQLKRSAGNQGGGRSRPMDGDERFAVLTDAAKRLFYERGYHAVSLRDLAAEVGISVSSLYYYFDSKESLLYQFMVQAIDLLIDQTKAAIQAGTDDSPTSRLRAAIVAFVSFNVDDRTMAHLVSREYRSLVGEQKAVMRQKLKVYEKLMCRLVEDCVAAGEAEVEDTTMTAYLILNACGSVSGWFQRGGRLGGEDVARVYSDLLMRMVTGNGTTRGAGELAE